MKTLLETPIWIYAIAGIGSLCIMLIVDFLLGPEAEHLNAWAIVNKLIGNDAGIPDSLAIQHFGLFGATLTMLVVNFIFGGVLLFIIKSIINLFH